MANKNEESAGVYSAGIKQLSNNIIDLLIKHNLSVALAESCTGGSVCGELTGIAGAGNVVAGGINTYMTRTKIEILGVKKEIIDNFGVVSEPCAKEMALNALKMFKSDIAVSVTGYLGPDGGDMFAQAGTVFIAVASLDGISLVSFKFDSLDRADNKSVTVQRVLQHLLSCLS